MFRARHDQLRRGRHSGQYDVLREVSRFAYVVAAIAVLLFLQGLIGPHVVAWLRIAAAVAVGVILRAVIYFRASRSSTKPEESSAVKSRRR